jgi:regulator of cell morphogenesis and NO signaling
MIYTREMKMADIIHHDYLLVNVIRRFDIQLGFGEKTIGQLCAEKGIHPDFFLEIANTYSNPDYFPRKHLQSFPVSSIVEYLKKTHHYYINEKIPEIEALFNQMVKGCYPEISSIGLLDDFFANYKKQLFDHIQREEEEVFPYVLAVEHVHERRQVTGDVKARIAGYSINQFKEDHDNIEDKLFDLKNIIIKYLPSPGRGNLCNRLLIELFVLEKDIRDHSRIEEKVMGPKIQAMEKAIVSILGTS